MASESSTSSPGQVVNGLQWQISDKQTKITDSNSILFFPSDTFNVIFGRTLISENCHALPRFMSRFMSRFLDEKSRAPWDR
jgi:hypothetical protein